jgi:oligopeptide transport system ATP-binding protein
MAEQLLDVRSVSVTYGRRGGRRDPIRAVTDVDLHLERGETLGLVGESGCGKSTLARALLGLEPATGEIWLDGLPLPPTRSPAQARRVAIVFQDPYASLNPRMSVGAMLAEMVRVHRLRPREEIGARVRELLSLVGLPERALQVRPAALSGGQRQRVAIARALALEPEVLIADEPTTSLDVSIQAVILELFAQLGKDLGLGLLLITHNLAVVGAICDRVAVMYLGRIIEVGTTEAVLTDPRHPYTRRLVAAVPRLSVQKRAPLAALAGDPPSPAKIPSGCPFHPRCADATDHCRVVRPELLASPAHTAEAVRTTGPAPPAPASAGPHRAACHYAWEPTSVPTALSGAEPRLG